MRLKVRFSRELLLLVHFLTMNSATTAAAKHSSIQVSASQTVLSGVEFFLVDPITSLSIREIDRLVPFGKNKSVLESKEIKFSGFF